MARLTFDFWEMDAPRCQKAWDTLLKSLELAEYIQDPTVGRVIQ